jgi:hypothetical protein
VNRDRYGNMPGATMARLRREAGVTSAQKHANARGPRGKSQRQRPRRGQDYDGVFFGEPVFGGKKQELGFYSRPKRVKKGGKWVPEGPVRMLVYAAKETSHQPILQEFWRDNAQKAAADYPILMSLELQRKLKFHVNHPRFGPVTGKIVGWERTWSGGQGGGRFSTITLGACLGTGATGDGDVEDVDYEVDAEDVAVPVDATALGIPGYALPDVQIFNDADDQIALIENEVGAGRDPTNTLANNPGKIILNMRSLSSVPTIEREIHVTGTLLDSHMGYDAGAD